EFGDVPGGTCGVVPGTRREFSLANEFAALSERWLLAEHRPDRCNIGAFDAEELMPHAMKMFADDMKPRFREKMVDVGNASVKRILDGNDGEIGFAFTHREERLFESRAGYRERMRERFPRGEIGVGAGLALKGDANRRR